MNLSQLKEQVRNILRERSVKAIQKEYSSVVDDIQKHLELYKKSKGTPDEKKHVGHLKSLGEKMKKVWAELDKAVAGLYKNAELKVDEAITNPKKSNPNDLATTVIGWYDFATDYIDDGGQRRRAIKSNEDVVKWFDSHPLDVKQKAFKVMLSKQPSIKSKIERVFGSSLKESVNEAKTYKKGDKLKIKLPNGKKFDVVFDMYSRTKGVALGKFKDGSGEYAIKPFNLDTIVESVNEATKVHFEKKLKNGTSFQVIDRDTSGMRGTQDKFRMQIVDKSGKVIKDLGSHPSIKGAEKFGNRFESVNEATEPEVISQLKDIVKNQQYQSIKDPKTGKKVKVDMQTANTVLKIYDGLSNVNKQTMVKMGLPKMIDVSNKIISKYR
jgi:hypothetical protein